MTKKTLYFYGVDPETVEPPRAPEWFRAYATILRRYAEDLDNGVCPTDIGAEIELIGRTMARRI